MAGATVATWVKVRTKTGLTSRPISHKYEGGANYATGQTITQSEYNDIKASRSEKVSTMKEKLGTVARQSLPPVDAKTLRSDVATYNKRKVVKWERNDSSASIRVMQISSRDDKYYVTEPYPSKGGLYTPLTDPLSLREANVVAKKLLSSSLPKVNYPSQGRPEYFTSEFVKQVLNPIAKK